MDVHTQCVGDEHYVVRQAAQTEYEGDGAVGGEHPAGRDIRVVGAALAGRLPQDSDHLLPHSGLLLHFVTDIFIFIKLKK